MYSRTVQAPTLKEVITRTPVSIKAGLYTTVFTLCYPALSENTAGLYCQYS